MQTEREQHFKGKRGGWLTIITEEMRTKGRPILLRRVLEGAGIAQASLARRIINPRNGRPVSRALINTCINYGSMPLTIHGFKADVEKAISGEPKAMKWLAGNGLKLSDIWRREGKAVRPGRKPYMPANHVDRVKAGVIRRDSPAMGPGDPENFDYHKEVEMLTKKAMKHFKIFRSPFLNDIRDVGDIFLSEEHRFIEAAMVDAAKVGGLLAVIGEVGSGKSVIRKKVVAELANDESSRIIYPRMIDKTRITAASICDAIVMDLSDETPKARLEQKARQVERLLVSRSQAGCHVCLIIEEAHDLTVRVLKLLKRFHELEDGYKKALGIVLIGQPELGALFNEQDHYDMREVIRRCQVAHIRGLNGNIKPYLALKFKRVGAKLGDVVTDKAIEALGKRLVAKDERGREISNAFPLTVNNYITRAMNDAADLGEPRVTDEVIGALR
jgi:type II secretory pathway predicted ATPase ExeA